MKTYKYRIGKDIYPDLEKEIKDKLDSELEKLGIKISFLFDDGVEFEYSSELDVRNSPADVSFYQGVSRLLTYTESFGELIFLDSQEKEIIRIPTYDPREL